MSIYKCGNCGKFFSEDDLEIKRVDMENYYGVGNDFNDHHYQDMGFCPYCESDDICELEESEILEELNK